jgi:hypothetical protein
MKLLLNPEASAGFSSSQGILNLVILGFSNKICLFNLSK